MPLEDILLALRAADEGAIHRDELSQLLSILDTWERGGLEASCGELLTSRFRVDTARVRKWEREITGSTHRRIGRYQLRRKVGQGGMGLVFEAHDPSLGRTVALKLLAGDRLASPISVQRFLREAKSAGALNHPNIVHAFDAGIDGDLPFLVMEFVDGENLYQILKRRGTIDPADGVVWLAQAARALEVLQRRRWVHGDVKPSNFILTRDGVVKLADLGLCGPPGKPRPGTSPHGTPPYIAPEVLDGDFVDHRADLYSLGATIFHLLAGRPHILSRRIEDLRVAIEEPIPRLSSVRADVPPELDTIVARLLARRPEDRYSGGAAVLEALDPLLGRRVDPAATTDDLDDWGEEDDPSENGRSPRRAAWIALVAAVVVVGVSVGIAFGPGRGGGGGDGGAEDPGGEGTASGTEVPTESTDTEGTARWRAARAQFGDDFPALFSWISDQGDDHPEADVWRAEVSAALAAAAGPEWERTRDAVEAARDGERFHAALAALDAFPERFRAGSFAVAWGEALESTRRSRDRRLAGILLSIDEAGTPLGAWRAWRAFAEGQGDREDRLWFRLRIRDELGGLPFLAEIDAILADALRGRATRPREVREALAEGRSLEPRFDEPARIPQELALLWLVRHPTSLGTAGSVVARLHEAELLADIPVGVLQALLEAAGEEANADAEVAAARLAVEAEAARRALDLDTAIARWETLARPPLSDTVTGRALLPRVDDLRTALERRAFLRSSHFVATVEGGWDATPQFRWDPADPRFPEEWRLDSGRWSTASGVLRARGRSGVEGLELAIPLEPSFTLTFDLHIPDRAWTVVVGLGDSVLGFAGHDETGTCRATAGDRAEVSERLAAGRGTPWRLGVDPEGGEGVRVSVEYRDGIWRIGGGNEERIFPTSASPPPAWLWVAVPAGAEVRAITLTGRPVAPWLEARRRFVTAGE